MQRRLLKPTLKWTQRAVVALVTKVLNSPNSKLLFKLKKNLTVNLPDEKNAIDKSSPPSSTSCSLINHIIFSHAYTKRHTQTHAPYHKNALYAFHGARNPKHPIIDSTYWANNLHCSIPMGWVPSLCTSKRNKVPIYLSY